jgi:transposase
MKGVVGLKPKYDLVYLTSADRKALREVTGRGNFSNQIRTRAHILLALDENTGSVKDQGEIADVLKCTPSTIRKVAKLFCKGGIDAVLTRKKRQTPPVPAKVTGEVEARIIMIACSNPPEGYARWTLRLIEDKIARIEDMPNLSDNTIGRLLKKHHLSLT